MTKVLQERLEWMGIHGTPTKPLKFLDYACGTGTATRALVPYVTTVRGIDLSENMVNKYNAIARSAGMAAAQVTAECGDFCVEQVLEPFASSSEWRDFDLAAVLVGFHHFESPALAIRNLAASLRPKSGTLIIVDILPFQPDHVPTHMQPTIKHHGFSEEEMRKLMEEAGLESFEFEVLQEPIEFAPKEGVKRQMKIFIAKGTRG
nr:putative methyltransferase c1347.09 [Quercus suber]